MTVPLIARSLAGVYGVSEFVVFLKRSLLAAPSNYTILHSGSDCAVKSKVIDLTPMPPRLVRKAPDTYHHGDLREALVQAALQDAEQGGPEAISLKALAKKLGVSQPAPYRHFADREPRKHSGSSTR
jgi:hypothetical protein